MNRLLLSMGALIFLMVVAFLIYPMLGSDSYTVFKDGWVVHPATGQGAKPTFKKDRWVNSGSWTLGKQGGVNGAAGSSVTKEFNCGDIKSQFCSVRVTFVASSVSQGEKMIIKLSNPTHSTPKQLKFSIPAAAKSPWISIADCTDKCVLSVGLEGTTPGSSIGSTVSFHGVTSDCTVDDKTATDLTFVE